MVLDLQAYFYMCLQVFACGYLGHWYREVGKDLKKAKNCYEETLLIDPKAEGIADCLKEVNCELGLLADAAKAQKLAALAVKPPSAFAPQSQTAFANLSPRGNSPLPNPFHQISITRTPT